MRKSLVAFLATIFAVAALAGSASAAQNEQDGLVNIAVFDVTVIDGDVVLVLNRILSDNNVNVGVAAQIAANICGVKVGPVAVLGRAVDRSGDTRTVCGNAQEIGDQVVTFEQN
jgi:hypothetical protein